MIFKNEDINRFDLKIAHMKNIEYSIIEIENKLDIFWILF